MKVALNIISFGSWVLDFFKTSRGQWFFLWTQKSLHIHQKCRFWHLQAAHSDCAHPLPSPPQRLQWTRRGHTCQHSHQTPRSTQIWSISVLGKPDARSPPRYISLSGADAASLPKYSWNTDWHILVEQRMQCSNSQILGQGQWLTGPRYPTRPDNFWQYPIHTRFVFRIIGYFGYRVFQKKSFLAQSFVRVA